MYYVYRNEHFLERGRMGVTVRESRPKGEPSQESRISG